jgi:murein DD-endopeptidase MepM/ murein hydrolase activator NlpD
MIKPILAISILFGTIFTSANVEAGFLSSLLGDQAHAGANAEISSAQPPIFGNNSQTIALLEANVSSSSIFSNKKSAEKKDDINDTDSDIQIVSDNALMPSVSHLSDSTTIGIGNGDFSFDQVSIYVVRSGDTLSQVADMFGVTVDTILSANDITKGTKLKEGEVLLILPFSGIEHKVAKGQTLQGIANLYKVDVDEILSANDIELSSKIAVGEKLMIPGANLLIETKPKSSSGSVSKPGKASMPSIAGYFKNPVPNGRKSRGITSKHHGVDIAAPTGTPIYAAASGRVLAAKMGWNGAYGNMVILQHSNGTKTLYAHMSKLGTSTNAQVSKGDVIGYVGNTGRSTGPHLHFEVIGAKNPF